MTLLSDDALHWVAEGAAAAGLALDPAAVAAWARGRDCLGPLEARAHGVLPRLLTLGRADRAGPDRIEDVADAARRRWGGDPGYRPRPLARLSAALGEAVAALLPR